MFSVFDPQAQEGWTALNIDSTLIRYRHETYVVSCRAGGIWFFMQPWVSYEVRSVRPETELAYTYVICGSDSDFYDGNLRNYFRCTPDLTSPRSLHVLFWRHC